MGEKVGGMVGILRRFKNLIPGNAKLLLYKSAIMSHLTYYHLMWNFCTASDSRKLKRLQEIALRLVYNTTTDSYDTLLERAKLITLQNRRLQDILILMFKVKKQIGSELYCTILYNIVLYSELYCVYIADIFNINEEASERHNLRNADFVLPRFNTVAYGRHSLRFLGPQLSSKLSKEERNIGTLTAFRTKIRIKGVTSIVEGCGSQCRFSDLRIMYVCI